jgi:amidohydrolase
MLADGVMEAPRPAASFGLHLWSQLPTGAVVVQEGPLWAAADVVNVSVFGKAGHGAMPHDTIDAILVAAQIVVAWQTIVARSVDPTKPAVVTVGKFTAGTAPNVIAGRVDLSCSIRSLANDVRDLLVRRMDEIAAGICAAHGARHELTLVPGVPVTQNSADGAALMRSVATAVVGAEKVVQITPMMVGEDMSEFLNRAPGCYVLVGAADPGKPLPAAHHNERFDFDESVLPTGVALLAGTALAWLRENQGTGSSVPAPAYGGGR